MLIAGFTIDGDAPDNFDSLVAADPSPSERRALADFRLSPDAIIQLLYTSGTTGEPKGVCHTSNTMLSNLVPFAERLGLGRDDVFHMPSPMAHQLGFMYGLVLPVMLGATAVLQDVFVPAEMRRQIAETGALNGGDVNEHVIAAGIRGDEAEALGGVEPLDGSLIHGVSFRGRVSKRRAHWRSARFHTRLGPAPPSRRTP